jgi:predicted neuraminidase
MRLALLFAAFNLAASEQVWGQRVYSAELIFPLEHWHNHSSSVVELPTGDLLVCWFHGSGERQADDVVVMGSRWSKRTNAWSQPFLMADTPLFPDTNPTMFIDNKNRLWLFSATIIANEWHTALMKYKVSTDYLGDGVPKWEREDNLLIIPKNIVKRTEEVFAKLTSEPGRAGEFAAGQIKLAHDKYFSRLGWFTRTHPMQLPSGRILVPMYSDGYSFSIMGISDDGGMTWYGSEPIVGFGNIQPSVLRRKNGELVAYMRDNGPPPKRVHTAYSKDDGITWTAAEDTNIPNPGSSLEGAMLQDGRWVLVFNDTEKGRNSLAISMSDDEGRTWKWKRHLETDNTAKPGQFHYPSIVQARDGAIHITYSYFVNLPEGQRKSIKHARLTPAWIEQGDHGLKH